MVVRPVETSRQFLARLAGFTFLFYMAIGIVSVVLYDRASSAQGTEAILSLIGKHASEVRMAIVLELLECFSALVLAVTLYGVTCAENRELALMGMICRVAEGMLSAVGITNALGLLWLATSDGSDPAIVKALGTFMLMPPQSARLGAPFFAVGSTLFSYLFLRGRMIPMPLAWSGVLTSFLLAVALPFQIAGLMADRIVQFAWIAVALYQLLLGVWLLVKGVPPILASPEHSSAIL